MNTRQVAKGLLAGIASRGPDATGAAWYSPEEDAVKITKIAVPVYKFIPAREDVIPENAPVMLLHTRMATHGTTRERANNHPIHHRNIVGIHNGVLMNDDEIFRDLSRERNGQVDSEAIMALLSDGTNPTEVLSKISGDAAVAWINLDQPGVLHLARVNSRPLCVAQTEEGSLVFASTMDAIRSSLKAAGLSSSFEMELDEAMYMRVEEGVVTDYLPIPGVVVDEKWTQRFEYTSGPAKTTTPKTLSPEEYAAKVARMEAKKAKKGSSYKFDAGAVKNMEALDRPNRPAWWSLRTVEELATLAVKGSNKAVIELARRGRNEAGMLVMPDRVKVEA